jgi:glycosyltransferase involved in cell wall biosynthesis
MNIALAHFRVGYTDGVSLEMDKWKQALEDLGHKVYYISGESNGLESFHIEELSISSKQHKKNFHNCYERLDDYKSEKDLIQDLEAQGKIIGSKLIKIIQENHIDLIIPNNIFSLGLHIPAALGFKQAIVDTQVKVMNHHHDFYWERSRYDNPTVNEINEYLNELFPYRNDLISHCVINKIAQEELLKRKKVTSTVVPNVFDFDKKPFVVDSYNQDLRKRLNIEPNDIVFLQATRIEDRKAIELAIDTCEQVNHQLKAYFGHKLYDGRLITEKTKIHLIIAGLNELKEDKMMILNQKIKQASYDILLINYLVDAKRSDIKDKVYALWDTYAISDFVTYPSILEGWGNQFLEAVFSKKPILVYEYPVYLTDIKPFGFETVSLGSTYSISKMGLFTIDKNVVNHASKEILDLLTNKENYLKTVDKNYHIGYRNFSIKKLKSTLNTIINNK